VGGDTAYFNDPDMAALYATDNGAQMKTYADSYNYWNIYLNPGSDWDVLRNDYYKCNITRIMFPGATDAQLPSPDATPTEDTNISVTVNPLFWNAVPMVDYELTP
jgi:hypothetical protein